jgi:hypothetical protein
MLTPLKPRTTKKPFMKFFPLVDEEKPGKHEKMFKLPPREKEFTV